MSGSQRMFLEFSKGGVGGADGLLDVLCAVGSREEGSLELRRREIDALLQHVVKKLAVSLRVGLFHRIPIHNRTGGKEGREHRPDSGLCYGDPGLLRSFANSLG